MDDRTIPTVDDIVAAMRLLRVEEPATADAVMDAGDALIPPRTRAAVREQLHHPTHLPMVGRDLLRDAYRQTALLRALRQIIRDRAGTDAVTLMGRVARAVEQYDAHRAGGDPGE